MTAPARRTDIDGLRGLAVMLVVGFHAGFAWLGGAFVAVDVFFVLSGFFLAASLARQLVADDEVDLPDVYARRIWRLLPGLAVVLVATLGAIALLYAPIDRAAAAGHVTAAALFSSNLVFAAGGVNYFHAGENPALHTWTLGVEWQLVLVVPAIVAGLAWIGRRRANHETTRERHVAVMASVLTGIVAVAVASFAVSVATSAGAPMWAYFGPHTRLWAFAAGVAVAFVAGEGQSLLGASAARVTLAQTIGLAAIALPAFFYDRGMPYPGAIALAPVGGTVLILAGGAIAGDTLPGRLLSSTPLAALGRVSYAWYLWHWPLMVLGAVLAPELSASGRFAWGLAGLPLAVLTQRLVERPALTWSIERWLPWRALWYAAAVSAGIVALAQVVAFRGRQLVANTVQATFAAARDDHMTHGCWARSAVEGLKTECPFGDVRSPTTIALLGDSHAEHWLGGLDRAGKERGWRIEPHVMGGCPVSDFSGLTSGSSARRFTECHRYREAALRHLIAQRPRAVLLSSYDSYMEVAAENSEYRVHEAAWTAGLRRTYSRLVAAGIPVIVMRGTPRLPFDAPVCLSRRAAELPFAGDCMFAIDAAFVSRARHAQDVAARGLDVRFVDMNDRICASARCPTMRGGIVMFTDDNHLTATFARSMGDVLGARLDAAMSGRGSRSVTPGPTKRIHR